MDKSGNHKKLKEKNPNIFLEFAASHPQIKFKILGKNWDKSHLWARMNSIKNIEYHEYKHF
jgi:hypothetical protein